MRRILAATAGAGAVLLASACFAPAPCTRALYPTRVAGSYRVDGWSGSVAAGSGAPLVPVVSDSRVEVLDGEADFRLGAAEVHAPAGASFRFELSTGSAPVPSILVSSGLVTVSVSSGAAAAVGPGQAYAWPAPR